MEVCDAVSFPCSIEYGRYCPGLIEQHSFGDVFGCRVPAGQDNGGLSLHEAAFFHDGMHFAVLHANIIEKYVTKQDMACTAFDAEW